VIVGIKHPCRNLTAGFGVERRVIKNDLASVTGLDFLRALPVVDDGQNFTAVGASLPIPFEERFRELSVCRLAVCSPRPSKMNAHGSSVPPSRDRNQHCQKRHLISAGFLDKILRQPVGIVKLECLRAGIFQHNSPTRKLTNVVQSPNPVLRRGNAGAFITPTIIRSSKRCWPWFKRANASSRRESPSFNVCINLVSSASTIFDTRSLDSISSGYGSCIKSTTAGIIS